MEGSNRGLISDTIHPSIQWPYSPYRALASKGSVTAVFYGVGLLAPRPTPNLEDQVSLFMTPETG
jgi:hypothetical protein